MIRLLEEEEKKDMESENKLNNKILQELSISEEQYRALVAIPGLAITMFLVYTVMVFVDVVLSGGGGEGGDGEGGADEPDYSKATAYRKLKSIDFENQYSQRTMTHLGQRILESYSGEGTSLNIYSIYDSIK